MSAIKITNDISLSKAISVTVSENYITALEFINSNPDYSLVKFREVVSEVIKLIASKSGIIFENEKLFDNIGELHDSQLIHFSLYENLHKVRKLGNKGAHNSISPDTEDGKEFQKARKKSLIESASQARKIIVSIFEDALYIIKNQKITNKIELSTEGLQELREILYDASISVDPKLKLKAGVICEMIMKDQFFDDGLIFSHNRRAHFDQLFYTAVSFYNASCEISANIDMNNPGKCADTELIVQKHADTEALFRFASLASDENSASDLYKLSLVRLKVVADRGYSPAEAIYGSILYEKKEYAESYKYLMLAAEKSEPIALNQLYLMFSEGDCCEVDYEKAMLFLNQALELEDPDAFTHLGIAYYKGIIFPENVEKGRDLLQKSVGMGSVIGKKNQQAYELTDILSRQMECALAELEKSLIKHDVKVGRNDQCPCESGKKYKKCCGRNI